MFPPASCRCAPEAGRPIRHAPQPGARAPSPSRSSRAQTERALDNLFGRGDNRERQLSAFRKLVAAAPKEGNLVLVTHGSTTLAFTGVSPGTAELVIVTPDGGGTVGTGGTGGTFRLAGRIAIAD